MDFTIKNLKSILNVARTPCAIFDLDLNIINSNDIFDQYYYFKEQDKTLIMAENIAHSNNDILTIDLQLLFAYPTNHEVHLHEFLHASITPLLNENDKHYAWLLSLKQAYVAYERKFISNVQMQDKFRLLVENMPQIVWITDADGLVEFANRQWLDYTGLTFEQTLAGEWNSIMHPDDLQNCLIEWQRCLETKDIYEVRIRFKRASDGMYRWHLSRSFPIFDEKGELKNWYGTCTDIHDVKKIEESLRSEQQRYNTLVQTLQTVYWTTDEIGGIAEPQPLWEAFTGQSFEVYQGFGWVNAVHPDDREETAQKWNQVMKNPQIYQNTLRIWSEVVNDYVYCIARAAPLLDENGKVIKWIGTCLDINSHKQIEKQLQEMSEHLTLALEAANGGAWSYDPSQDKVIISDNMYKLFGAKENSVNQFSDFAQVVNHEDIPAIKAEINEVLAHKKDKLQCQYRVTKPDGSVSTFSSKGKLFSKDNVVKLIGASFDVTERVKLEQLARQTQLDFDKEFRNTSAAEIVSLLAHEINQPLAVISTFAQGCMQKLTQVIVNKDDLMYALNELLLQSERAGEIIHRIKNSVRKQYLYVESTNFQEIIEEAIRFIRYEQNNEHVSIHHQASIKTPTMLLDKVQIQQVLVNLLRNAIETFIDFHHSNPQVVISYELNDAQHLLFKITDNGPGFPAAILNQETLRLSTKHEGVGIGLRICRSVIEAHGGSLSLTNLKQGGAQVSFTIPIVAE